MVTAGTAGIFRSPLDMLRNEGAFLWGVWGRGWGWGRSVVGGLSTTMDASACGDVGQRLSQKTRSQPGRANRLCFQRKSRLRQRNAANFQHQRKTRKPPTSIRVQTIETHEDVGLYQLEINKIIKVETAERRRAADLRLLV